jgi:hypothetical protein
VSPCKNSFPVIYFEQIYSQLYELCAELAFCVKICVKRPCMRVPVSCVDSPCVISVSCVENWVYIWQNLVTKTEGCTLAHNSTHTLHKKLTKRFHSCNFFCLCGRHKPTIRKEISCNLFSSCFDYESTKAYFLRFFFDSVRSYNMHCSHALLNIFFDLHYHISM